VSFILNINEVDVTPSRENVIWNTKTREAVKRMFISAQKTVTDLIEDKIKNETNLPDLALLANFKDKNTISGINELYKIIDVSQIENTYRDFKIGEAALQMSELDVRKISYVLPQKIQTSTVVELPTLIILVFLRSLFQS
jgi:histidyl-tRNA synthetase